MEEEASEEPTGGVASPFDDGGASARVGDDRDRSIPDAVSC